VLKAFAIILSTTPCKICERHCWLQRVRPNKLTAFHKSILQNTDKHI